MIADFTERLVDGSKLVVYDPCGEQVDNGDSLVAADRITVTMSGDRTGTYRVNFDVVSAVDGHPTNGSFSFTATGGEPCPGEEPTEEEPEQPSGGGGNNNSASSSSSGAGGSGDSGTATSSAASRTSRTGDSSQPRAKDDGGKDGNATDRRPGKKTRANDNGSAASDLSSTSASAAQAEEVMPSVWDGIPLGVYFVGLAISTLIGAAGGKIYAGIMGWRA